MTYNRTNPTIITDWASETRPGKHLTLQYPGNKELTDDTWAVFRFVDYSYDRRHDYFKPHNSNTKTSCTIRLPLPNNMKHGYNANITTTEFGPIADTLARSINAGEAKRFFGSTDLSSAWDAGTKSFKPGSGNDAFNAVATTAVKNIVTSIAGALGNTDGLSLAEAATGVAINNNLGAAFKGVDLRSFDFTYSFFPESQRDNIELKNIVNAFRWFMSPGYFGSNKFVFEYPNLVTCTFEMGTDSKNVQELQAYRINPSFITNFGVDYSGQANSSSFHIEDGHPTATFFSFGLKEVGIMDRDHIKAEISDMNSHSIQAYNKRVSERFANEPRGDAAIEMQYDRSLGF